MSMLWLPAPRQAPNRCFLTGLSSREHGPYLEVDAPPGRPYIDPVTRREGRMYWSFASWRTTVVAPDSPYKLILEEEVAKRTEELTQKISELEDKLASDPVRVAMDKFMAQSATKVDDIVSEEPEVVEEPVVRPKREFQPGQKRR